MYLVKEKYDCYYSPYIVEKLDVQKKFVEEILEQHKFNIFKNKKDAETRKETLNNSLYSYVKNNFGDKTIQRRITYPNLTKGEIIKFNDFDIITHEYEKKLVKLDEFKS